MESLGQSPFHSQPSTASHSRSQSHLDPTLFELDGPNDATAEGLLVVVGRGRGDDMRDGPTNRPELEVIIQRLSRLRVPLRMSSREGLKAGHDLPESLEAIEGH